MTIRIGISGLAVLASIYMAGQAVAKDRRPTADETLIATAFDHAVREDASLTSLSKLPWADGAAIWQPAPLGNLKNCKTPVVRVYKHQLLLNWQEAAYPTDATRPCGQFGYFAIVELKGDRIKRVTFGENDIVVT